MVRDLQSLGSAYLLSGSTANRQRVFDYYCDSSSAKESLLFSIELYVIGHLSIHFQLFIILCSTTI